MNDIIKIKNVRVRINGKGIAELNIEDVAYGLGFTETKNGVEYVKWRRVSEYLKAFGYSPQVAKDDFIPENIFYKLCFKASNETARNFHNLVSDEILPTIRRTGGFVASDELFIETYMPYAEESTKQMFRSSLAMVRQANRKIGMLEVKLNESEKYWTIMKFNQTFNLKWDMKTCQHNGKAASVYSRQHGYEILKCQTNDERFKETNSYVYEVLETLFLPNNRRLNDGLSGENRCYRSANECEIQEH